MNTQPPSIKDVARKAGVSTSLVSLVINNRPKVSPHREARVRAAIAELGYVPPPPGRRRGPRLNTRRLTHRIALVVAVRDAVILQAPVYADLLHAVVNAAAEQGKATTIHHIFGSELPPETAEALRQSDGIIFFGKPVRGPLMRALQTRPCVRVMGVPDAAVNWDHVSYNNTVIGRLAGEYVLSLGCRRAAYMGPVEYSGDGDPVTEERGVVFRQTFEAGGGSVAAAGSTVFVGRINDRHGVDTAAVSVALDKLFAVPEPPQAIFVPGDLLASTLHSMLLARGKRPGEDVHIVSVNNERILLDHLTPRPATIDIHAARIGEAAVEMLNRRIEKPDTPRSEMLLIPTLIPGGACP